jgi:hypothetical protein
VGIGLLAAGAYYWWPKTQDDAFITFRYARNLVAGLGPVYNSGERVEGYSTPLWMLGSAGAMALRVDPVIGSKWVGVLAVGTLSVAVYFALRVTRVPPWGAGLASWAVGGSFVLVMSSTSGMETTTYAALFFIGLAMMSRVEQSVRGALWASVFLVAAALTRPEGLLFWVLGLALYLKDVWFQPRRLLAFALPGAVIAGHFAWRNAYYGALLPNTYYAKTVGGGVDLWRQGMRGLGYFVSEPANAVLVSAAVIGVLLGLRRPETRRATAIMGGATLAHLIWVVSVGDDGLFQYRFYAPIIGPLAFLVGLLFYRRPTAPPLSSRKRRAKRGTLTSISGRHPSWSTHAPVALGTLAIISAVGLSVLHFRSEEVVQFDQTMDHYLEGNVKLGRFLATSRGPDTVIAVPSAGAIPFYSGLPTIDLYGLNDYQIARAPFQKSAPGRMMKWDHEYALSRAPDLIVMNWGYRRPGENHDLAIAPMDEDLLERLESDPRYQRSTINFDDGSSFLVIEKRAGH